MSPTRESIYPPSPTIYIHRIDPSPGNVQLHCCGQVLVSGWTGFPPSRNSKARRQSSRVRRWLSIYMSAATSR